MNHIHQTDPRFVCLFSFVLYSFFSLFSSLLCSCPACREWPFSPRHLNDVVTHHFNDILTLIIAIFTPYQHHSRRLDDIGATRIYPLCRGDDAKGVEVVVEPWLTGLWEALANAAAPTAPPAAAAAATATATAAGGSEGGVGSSPLPSASSTTVENREISNREISNRENGNDATAPATAVGSHPCKAGAVPSPPTLSSPVGETPAARTVAEFVLSEADCCALPPCIKEVK